MRPMALVAAAAVALLAVPPLKAAAPAMGLGKAGVESSVTYTAGKTKKKAKAKTAKVVPFKSCGAFMYRKDGKCVDARAKK